MGFSFLGSTIDDNLWAGLGGAVITGIGVVWGILDKTATVEAIQSGLRSIIIVFGTLLVGSGVIKNELLDSLLAIVATIVPVLYSKLSRDKSKNIAAGKTGVIDLAGVDSQKQTISPKIQTQK
jgi:hypothetical protein